MRAHVNVYVHVVDAYVGTFVDVNVQTHERINTPAHAYFNVRRHVSPSCMCVNKNMCACVCVYGCSGCTHQFLKRAHVKIFCMEYSTCVANARTPHLIIPVQCVYVADSIHVRGNSEKRRYRMHAGRPAGVCSCCVCLCVCVCMFVCMSARLLQGTPHR